MLGSIVGRRGDAKQLSFAAFVTLLINPANVLLGFQLSLRRHCIDFYTKLKTIAAARIY